MMLTCVESIDESIGESISHTFRCRYWQKYTANTFFLMYRYWYWIYSKKYCYNNPAQMSKCISFWGTLSPDPLLGLFPKPHSGTSEFRPQTPSKNFSNPAPGELLVLLCCAGQLSGVVECIAWMCWVGACEADYASFRRAAFVSRKQRWQAIRATARAICPRQL